MSTPTEPSRSREHTGTYFVQDRGNVEELQRLQVQDRLVTESMGGVLPEQADPTIFERVLDVGCGTGGWLIAVAKAFPTTALLVGVDTSSKMISFAQAQTKPKE